MSCISSDSATPSPTAAATGSSSVATRVVITATWETRPVRRIARKSPVRSDPIAAAISTAASVGISTCPTTPDNATMITASHTPAEIAAQRPRAPAATLTAVCPTDPPTGWPRKSPASRLPTPCATKSRLVTERLPSGLGADSLTPAPWISTRAATARAPVTRSKERSERWGRYGAGRPVGISPGVVDLRDRGGPDRERHGRRHHDGDERGVRRQPGARQAEEDGQREQPGRQRRRVDQRRVGDQVPRLGQRDGAAHLGAAEVGELPEHDVHGDRR